MAAPPNAPDPEIQTLIAEIRHEVALRRRNDVAAAAIVGQGPGTDAKPRILARVRGALRQWLRTVGSLRVLRPAMRYVRGGRRLARALPRLARIDELLAATRDVIAHEQAQHLENFSRQALAMQRELRADITQLRQRIEVLESARRPAAPVAMANEEEDVASAAPKTAVFEAHIATRRGADGGGAT